MWERQAENREASLIKFSPRQSGYSTRLVILMVESVPPPRNTMTPGAETQEKTCAQDFLWETGNHDGAFTSKRARHLSEPKEPGKEKFNA